MQSAWVVKWWSPIAIFHPRIINKAVIASLKPGLLKMVTWLRMAPARKGKGKRHRQEVRVNIAPPCFSQRLLFSRGSEFCHSVRKHPGGSQNCASISSVPFLGHLWCPQWANMSKVHSDFSDGGGAPGRSLISFICMPFLCLTCVFLKCHIQCYLT